jgi:ribonuclease P protein component
MLASAARLRRRNEFAATVRGGRRAARGTVVVHLLTVPTPHPDDTPARAGIQVPARAGFVVSRAVGGAVVRNRVKRRLRHLVRPHLETLPPGTDLVVRALPAAADRSYAELGEDLAAALSAALAPRGARRSRSRT